MSISLDVSKFKKISISDIKEGHYIVNLGPVIEAENMETHYNLIIYRMAEKQVIKFENDTVLVTV
ncbi:hypothetical protein [Pedobacter sp. ASV28]|uniref:hypothetical protein n=1 Tax=Pedobacter sp. ASV28 TaxID=2795123 RepID=UPI0018EB3AC0|nr:hypothetical protein [Pedobacter sp. ASV28]